MKNLLQSPLPSFALLLSTFLLMYMLSSLNQGAVKLIPNEEAHTRQTDSTAADGFYNNQIDINTASAEQLSMLPGVGETIAQRIVSYRQANGLFKSIQDLIEVPGLGEKTIEAIAKYITAGGLS